MGISFPASRIIAALGALVASAVIAAPAHAAPAQPSQEPRLIIDTDFGQWWDDVAALATVHTAASQNQVKILGIMSDVDNPWDAPALDALDTWYGRPDIPIGVPSGAVTVDQNYSQLLAQNYPHSGRPENALSLYRRLLLAQPDHSVTILSIGALTNLAQLSRTDPGLVARKVSRTVIMGGQYPTATTPEWNFNLDLAATRQVVAHWPTPIVYDGFEIGGQIFVGNHVCDSHPADSPVRAVFNLLYTCGKPQTDGTWDPTAMYFAIYGYDGVFAPGGQGGHNVVTADGLNTWTTGAQGDQQYLLLTNPDQLTRSLDTLIDQVPAAHRQ